MPHRLRIKGVLFRLIKVVCRAGYGRVGHKVQVDCFAPKKLEALTGRVTAAPKVADAKVPPSFMQPSP